MPATCGLTSCDDCCWLGRLGRSTAPAWSGQTVAWHRLAPLRQLSAGTAELHAGTAPAQEVAVAPSLHHTAGTQEAPQLAARAAHGRRPTTTAWPAPDLPAAERH